MSHPQPTPASRRKRLGQWATPLPLVEHLVDISAATAVKPVRRVIDPACGDGRFLASARRRFGGTVELVGVDLDPAAVDAARAAVPGATIVCADALAAELPRGGFDLVLGNPPYLSPLSAATMRGGPSRFGGGPYANAAAEFLALAAQLAHPDGGQLAMVLPQSILAARDVAPIRAAISDTAQLTHAWWSTSRMFDADVHVCALVITNGAAAAPTTRATGPSFTTLEPVAIAGGEWARLLVERSAAPVQDASDGLLGDVAGFSLDFRDQYYGLVGAVSDALTAADGPPLVTSGLIDPGRCAWGERPVRFAKRTFRAPRVELAALSPALQRWAAQRLVPKVLVANQTRRIEAVVDRGGDWLPSVPVITCVPHDERDLDAVAAALSAPSSSAWVRERAAGTGLAPGVVRLTPALLAALPWPTDVTRTGGGSRSRAAPST